MGSREIGCTTLMTAPDSATPHTPSPRRKPGSILIRPCDDGIRTRTITMDPGRAGKTSKGTAPPPQL
jgi:hypothetical protein